MRARLWSSSESERTTWPKNLRRLALIVWVTGGWAELVLRTTWLVTWVVNGIAECVKGSTDRTHQVACRTSPSHSNIFGAHYLDNGSRYRLGVNEAPIWNGYLGIIWSRDLWRHVTVKGQGRDPNMLSVRYFENSWRYRLGFSGPPIGNDPNRWPWMTLNCNQLGPD